MDQTIHASAVLVGAKAALIRGASGAGKSRLTWDILQSGALPFTRLIADDRVHLEAHGGGLLVRPAPALAGLIEMRGLGLRRLAFEPMAVVGLVVDLGAADGERLPPPGTDRVTLEGIDLPRLAVAAGMAPLPILLAYLSTRDAGD